MKRRLLTILVFLLLGAIVNVAVAITCFRFSQTSLESTVEFLDDHHKAQLRAYGWDAFAMFTSLGLGLEHTIVPGSPIEWADRDLSTTLPAAAVRVNCGWPRRGLQVWIAARRSASQTSAAVSTRGVPYSRPALMADFWAPNLVWSIDIAAVDFGANTLLYSGLLWLLTTSPFVLRRRRRIKRGLCPACAYPVGASAVCTECGGPVTNRSAQAAA